MIYFLRRPAKYNDARCCNTKLKPPDLRALTPEATLIDRPLACCVVPVMINASQGGRLRSYTLVVDAVVRHSVSGGLTLKCRSWVAHQDAAHLAQELQPVKLVIESGCRIDFTGGVTINQVYRSILTSKMQSMEQVAIQRPPDLR